MSTMIKSTFVLSIFMICGFILFAQNENLLKEKPGTYKITYGILNGQGPDQYMKSCDFSDAEAEAAKKNLIALVGVFRRNPVLKEMKGFDGYCYLNGGRCNTKFGYGLPCTPCFFFETWRMRKGKEVKQTSEPPQWRFEVNMTEKFCSNGFNMTNYSNAYNATNPAFSEKMMDLATFALRELFFLPGVKEEVSSGVDRYGDNLIIYNPERPAYWVQVTIREVFRLLMDYWRLVPDQVQVKAIIPMLEKEFSGFPENEKDGFAYFGKPESIYRIGSEKNETPVMRPNPEYWNRKLPRSDIQFMWLEIPKKEEVKRKLERYLKAEDGYYYVYRLLDELNLNTLIPSIVK
ncbi:MAG: hypothetical protein WCP08_01495 [Prolixibacteraceae bacterium]